MKNCISMIRGIPSSQLSRVRWWYREFIPFGLVFSTAILLLGCQRTGPQLPAEPASSSSQTKYSCPMHPEMVAQKAGRCPKCGMDLVAAEAAENASTPH